MASRNPESTAQVAGHPIHPMLIPFPVAFLVATLVSDLIFLRTGNPGWATASLWLLGAALVMAALAAAAGLIDFLGDERAVAAGGADPALHRLARLGDGLQAPRRGLRPALKHDPLGLTQRLKAATRSLPLAGYRILTKPAQFPSPLVGEDRLGAKPRARRGGRRA